MKHWYVLHSKPNAEYQVAEALQGRGVETYLPEIESPQGRQGRKREPLFPCYLFVRIDLETFGISLVQWTPGLRRIVAFDDRPVPLSDEVIDLIQSKLEGSNAAGGWPPHSLQPGDTVRITEGPLQGMVAAFEGPATPAERVQVLLNFLGQVSRMSIAVTALEKAPPEAQAPAPKAPKRRRRTRGRGRRIKSSTFEPA